ncbi:MAG: c-type cytochrome [Candidatus Hydrogenedentes bacterium]|nr:c-type cytochrome [Candidatus Hydrogenedentota bacterium]
MKQKALVLAIAILSPALAWAAADPSWIWLDEVQDKQNAFFRTTFSVDGTVESAIVAGAGDNELKVYINGEQVIRNTNWGEPNVTPVRSKVKAGENVLALQGINQGGAAAVFCRLTITYASGKESVIATDGTWKASAKADGDWAKRGFDDSSWDTPKALGTVGDPGLTWTSKVTLASLAQAENVNLDPTPVAKTADNLNLLPGFKAERLYTVPKGLQGSWVSMTNGPKGDLFVSDQGGAGLYHIQPATLGDATSKTIVTPVAAEIGSAQGMLWAFDGLYVNVNTNPESSGLYRVTDSDGDGKLDAVEKLKALDGGGEHGPHAIILSEDGKNLYVNAGNHTYPPEVSGSRAPLNYGEDHLLPRQWDANGHAKGRMAPGGWVCKVTPDGKTWEFFSNGFRNEYDIALNAEGEMFTFDADMEWDMGSPWYRPTRVNHIVSGSEFGWRSGTGKWPTYYEDSLPAVLDIGPGSPTGVVAGTGAKFPAKYQQALFALDWTFGTIYTVHMTPKGASYEGVKEEFISGSPLPVTDAVIGADGAFYFTVGGRGTQSALYRVYYAGDEDTTPAVRTESKETLNARALRRSLEAFHGKEDAAAVETAWPYLGSADRHIRFAARIAIENQPVATWTERALSEQNPQAAAIALIALARQGDAAIQGDLLTSLGRFYIAHTKDDVVLDLLRAYALCFTRMGRPDQAVIDAAVAQIDPLLPSKNDDLNAELVRVLVYLDAPGIIEKGLALLADSKPPRIPDWAELLKRNQGYGGSIQKMLDNHPPSQKINYAFMLRNVRYGWSMEQREAYFTFINEAAKYPGGSSYGGFLTNIRDEALANCSDAEKLALAPITGQSLEALPTFEIKDLEGPTESWTQESIMAAVKKNGLTGRSFENGRNSFYAVGCIKCHRLDGAGGGVGPDLSSVSSKFSMADLIEAIIDPNKVISDQFSSSTITLNDGTTYEGIVVNNSGSEEEGRMTIYTSDPKADPIEVLTADVKSITPSTVSQMPEGQADFMSEDELLDLLAYLVSRGNPEDAVFK